MLRAPKVLLDNPILPFMGCQKLFGPHESPHQSPNPQSSGHSDSTDFLTSAGWDQMLAPRSREIFATWDPPTRQLACRLEAVIAVCPADRSMSVPAPLQLTGFLFSATGSLPHLLSEGLERRGRDLQGLKFKLLIKRVGMRRENTHPDIHFFCVYLILGQLRGGKTTFPSLHRLPSSVKGTHLQGCHVPVSLKGTKCCESEPSSATSLQTCSEQRIFLDYYCISTKLVSER